MLRRIRTSGLFLVHLDFSFFNSSFFVCSVCKRLYLFYILKKGVSLPVSLLDIPEEVPVSVAVSLVSRQQSYDG